ncbi:class I SAM-dependent DNA methyltransferase [Planococcus sp. 1R117A]|uniref:class I SAM-dependent DNA methyltransferase n=1 Tax=Planococcus sp. 1R117A TaxID=3447020 RepID=UPI003EDCAD8E
MEFKGASAYDQKDFLNQYLQRRSREESPNNAIEKPMIMELLGELEGKNILDLGCGDGSFGKELHTAGAKSYTGVEGSAQMATMAKNNLKGTNSSILQEAMETYAFSPNKFDLVTSRFAIHYVADIKELFIKVHQSLKENGKFVFSVQHPLTTSSFISKKEGERKGNWIVDDYFNTGERKEPWIDKIVVKHHRTTEQYFSSLTEAGFNVVSLREGEPKRENFRNEEEYQRRKRIPIMLAFSCEK